MNTENKDDELCRLTLLRCALEQHNIHARELLQQHYWPLMTHWFQCHPRKELACNIAGEERYIALGFVHFWQMATRQQQRFDTLATFLRALHLSLNCVILEALRTSAHPSSISPSESSNNAGVQDDQRLLWEAVISLLSNERERRVTFLLFHCGFTPQQILSYCPEEFRDIDEIYRLRHRIFDRLLHNTDYIRRQLNHEAGKENI